jgi:hypothetical protein
MSTAMPICMMLEVARPTSTMNHLLRVVAFGEPPDLSRRKQGFETPTGRQQNQALIYLDIISFNHLSSDRS